MRILVAVDQNMYSAHAVEEISKLALNTWADVILLGVGFKKNASVEASNEISPQPDLKRPPLSQALQDYRKRFTSHFQEDQAPYDERKCAYEWIEVQKGIWEELYVCRIARKDLKIRMRLGNPAREVLAESQEADSDLIVVGCNTAHNCLWEAPKNVPLKIASDAKCSVLVVKEEKNVDRIVCCLDHDKVSQESLEMINQMVTRYRAELEIVGLTDGEELKNEVEKKIEAILEYYNVHQAAPLLRLVEISALERFIAQEAKRSLIALWMGDKSILEKIFPPRKVGKLIRTSRTPVLLLR
jgi:nucleotide-binding universal stress UspA family protein